MFQISYPPYLFECFLYAPVRDVDSVAQVGNGAVLFKLLKVDPDKWPQLQADITGMLNVRGSMLNPYIMYLNAVIPLDTNKFANIKQTHLVVMGDTIFKKNQHKLLIQVEGY